MSIHPSLKGANTLTGDRSVLSRFERIQKLAKDGKLDPENDSAHGLPKVRTCFKVAGARKKAAAAAEGEAAAEAPAGEGEAEKPAED